jgi:hypothetical protein
MIHRVLSRDIGVKTSGSGICHDPGFLRIDTEEIEVMTFAETK